MFGTWGFGNRLFMYAALVIRANNISQPIIPILDTTKFGPLLDGTVFPNLRALVRTYDSFPEYLARPVGWLLTPVWILGKEETSLF